MKSMREQPESGRIPQIDVIRTVSTELEEDIVLGRLHPRERLIENDLAARFQTNRAVIRAALHELDRKGIIQRIPNRGAVVHDLSPEQVEQIYSVREELETLAARIIRLPVSADDIAKLEALQQQHATAVAARDLRSVFRSNLEFHRAMFSLCGNPYLIEMIEQLAEKSYAIRSYSSTVPEYLDLVRDQHLAMLDALRHGRRDELVDLLRRHLKPSRRAYIEAYEQRFGKDSAR
jgi:DNA-binding GntR family transcriptional regulator